jgi:hypothetical protein
VAPKRFHHSKEEPPFPSIKLLPREIGLWGGDECHAGRHRINSLQSSRSLKIIKKFSCSKQQETYSALQVKLRFWQRDCGALRGFPTRLSSLGHVLAAVKAVRRLHKRRLERRGVGTQPCITPPLILFFSFTAGINASCVPGWTYASVARHVPSMQRRTIRWPR